MREIKFRAWNEVLEKMYSWNEFLDTNMKQTFIAPESTAMILMQYTGLKDKNGKEIYEGDIVKITHRGETDIGKIIYEYNGFAIDVTNMQKPYGRIDFINYYTEVIGNIYDNKELLEEK